MQTSWRGLEEIQTTKTFVAICRPHRARLDESRTECALGCRIANVDSDDADDVPYDVVDESKVGAPRWAPLQGEIMRGVKGSGPGGGAQRVLAKQEFHSESGNRLWISLERDKSVAFAIRVRRKLASGGGDKGKLAARNDEAEARTEYNRAISEALGKDWILGRREGGLTEIPDADSGAEISEKPARKGRRAA